MDSKNNKSPGIDQTKEGLTKYSPEVVYEKFSDISITLLQPQGSTQMKSCTKF